MKKLLIPLPAGVNDINYGSGSLSSIYKSMGEVFDLIPVEPVPFQPSIISRGLNKLNRCGLFPWKFPTVHTWKTIRAYAEQLQKIVDNESFDAIFTTSTLLAAGIKTNRPVFAYTDFSYFNAVDYYDFASNLFPSSKKESLAMDKFCFESYTKVFLASDWAKETTTKAYQLNPGKIISIGRGANLVSGFSRPDLERTIQERVSATCKNFLFVGIDWNRKGGDTAYRIVKNLRHSGINAELQIVGCTPPKAVSEEKFVHVYPFLDRGRKNDLETLKFLFQKAWMFILPTKAEAMGIVFAEAASFGLPAISYNTGGVGAAVKDNKTGLLFNFSDSMEDMVSRILAILKDERFYKDLSENAFNKFSTELNWKSIAQKIKNEIDPFLV